MTLARCLELLRELQQLQLMARTIATFTPRADTRDHWQCVSVAISDRVALLRGVLHFEDPALVLAGEQHLAQEHANASSLASEVEQTAHEPSIASEGADITAARMRPTIH